MDHGVGGMPRADPSAHSAVDPADLAGVEARLVMTRSDRDAFFERLLALRAAYNGSAEDRLPLLAVADAITYAEAVMDAVMLDAEPWPAKLDASDAVEGEGEGGPATVELVRGEHEWPASLPPRQSSRSTDPDAPATERAPGLEDDLRN